ncbi:MAG: redox-active protein [Bacteroidales bacterium]|jgi:hypothetical protein|nr:redox-active protein [Bacteroidales bacterium]
MENKQTGDVRIRSDTYFHVKPENLNCAQSILKGFESELTISPSRIDEFRAYGGGRAKNGLCGALYAVETLLKEQGKPSVLEKFNTLAGDITCKAIKKNAKTSCLQCVKIADELLENGLNS